MLYEDRRRDLTTPATPRPPPRSSAALDHALRPRLHHQANGLRSGVARVPVRDHGGDPHGDAPQVQAVEDAPAYTSQRTRAAGRCRGRGCRRGRLRGSPTTGTYRVPVRQASGMPRQDARRDGPPRAPPRRRRPPAPGATTSPVSSSGTTTTGRDSPSPRSDSAPATADPPSRISPALTAYRWTQGMGC